MRLLIRVNRSDDPAARYIGWTPVPCSVRLAVPAASPVDVRIENPPAAVGRVEFRPPGDRGWTGAFTVTLPADGDPVEFEMAGLPSAPSERDGDAGVQATPVAGSAGPTVLPLMVRVRKNAEHLSDHERDLFLSALAGINDGGQGLFGEFRAVHSLAGDKEMHEAPGFLAWHRAFLLDFERELQRAYPAVALPYWRFDAAAPTIFSPDFMGAHDASGLVQFSATNPLFHWITDSQGGVLRSPMLWDPTAEPATAQTQTAMIRPVTFADFRQLERRVHTPVHLRFEGYMDELETAIRDPLFFLLHAALDRLWALWQQKHNARDPGAAHAYDSGLHRVGHNLPDTMWPWNQVVGDPRPQSAPGGHFPDAPVGSAPGRQPRVADVFDYQGVVDPAHRLGVDYDDVA
jgi:tyrosinase